MSVRTLTRVGLIQGWRSGLTISIGTDLVALGLLFRTEVTAALGVWQASTAYNHCFLVIPIVVYLIWDRRDALRHGMASPCPMAALAGGPLAVAWLFAERLGIMEGRQLVAMSFVELLFFVVLGPRLWRLLAGPLLYLYFLVPFGAFLTPTLQDFTTAFVAHGLKLLHIPAYITGYAIEISEGTFLIAEACAGLRFLIAAIAFGCLYALLMYRSAPRRALFVGVSIVVPIIANGFRALGIVALGHYLGSAEAVEADHVLYGWIFFSVVILILSIIGLPFREDLHRAPVSLASRLPQAHANHVRAALPGAAGLLVLAAIGPAIAVSIDRATNLDIAVGLPSFAPAPGCTAEPAPLTAGLDALGRIVVQRYDCGDGPVTLTAEVFSPRTTVSRLAVEQLRLTGLSTDDDIEASWLTMPNSPARAWRLMEATRSTRVAAAGLWIDGQPAQFGLLARLCQAWRGVFGAHGRSVIIVVTAVPDGMTPVAPAVDERRRAAERIVGFLRMQLGLSELVARLAGTVD